MDKIWTFFKEDSNFIHNKRKRLATHFCTWVSNKGHPKKLRTRIAQIFDNSEMQSYAAQLLQMSCGTAMFKWM